MWFSWLRSRHRESRLHRRVSNAAQLQAADLISARLPQRQVEVVPISRHDLHRADQVTARVVQTEPMIDVDGAHVEAHASAGRYPVGLERPEELSARHLDRRPTGSAAAVRKIE